MILVTVMASTLPCDELRFLKSVYLLMLRSKRKVLAALTVLPFGLSSAAGSSSDSALRRKFGGITGVVVVLDVAKGAAEKRYGTFTSDAGKYIAAPSRLTSKGSQILAFTGGVLAVPKAVHITWREVDPLRLNDPPRTTESGAEWIGGRLVGDYTVQVAGRIPNEVLDYIRAGSRRALRLKFRLKDDGVLFGWDVQEFDPKDNSFEYRMAGGDFLDTRY